MNHIGDLGREQGLHTRCLAASNLHSMLLLDLWQYRAGITYSRNPKFQEAAGLFVPGRRQPEDDPVSLGLAETQYSMTSSMVHAFWFHVEAWDKQIHIGCQKQWLKTQLAPDTELSDLFQGRTSYWASHHDENLKCNPVVNWEAVWAICNTSCI